jgi:hypothetical protein
MCICTYAGLGKPGGENALFIWVGDGEAMILDLEVFKVEVRLTTILSTQGFWREPRTLNLVAIGGREVSLGSFRAVSNVSR